MSIALVGTGMIVPDHLTPSALREIQEADWIGHLLDDEHKLDWLGGVSKPGVLESLYTHYGIDKDRLETYQDIADRVVEVARQGKRVCLVSYGHPLVYCQPSLLVAKQADALGLECRIVPAISSQDCLLADLGVNVADHGFMAMEAHDLTTYELTLDPSVGLILWQISLVGEFQAPPSHARHRGYLQLLGRILSRAYGTEHPAYIYLAATRPGRKFSLTATTVSRLHEAQYDRFSTLYVPPAGRTVTPRNERIRLLGLGPGGLTQATQHIIAQAPGVHALDLSPEEVEVLGEVREGPTTEGVFVCSGHPCYSRAAMRLAGDGACIEPAVSHDDALYGQFRFDPFTFGYQVRTSPSPLDASFSTLYLGPTPPGEGWTAAGPHRFLRIGFPKQPASAELAQEVYLSRAAEMWRRELERLPRPQLEAWKASMHSAEKDQELAQRSAEYFRGCLFAEACRSGVDLTQPLALQNFREAQPNSLLAAHFRLLQWSSAAVQALQNQYSLVPVRELLSGG